MSIRRDFPDLPPVWALGTVAAQWLVAWALPLFRLPGAAAWSWLPIAAGLALAIWAALWFRRKRTSIEPRDEPRALIVEGPFRLNRNPIYTGMTLCLIGTGLWFEALSALALALVFPWIITARFIRQEEATLKAAFPDTDYFDRTRRW